MTQISDVIAITINVQDLRLSRAGFGTPLFLATAENTVFSERTKSYADIGEVAVDFAIGTKPYRAATAFWSQANTPPTVKMGRQEAGDGTVTAALTAIQAADPDWYFLVIEDVDDTSVAAAAAWAETNGKLAVLITEEEDVLLSPLTDIASTLKAASYNRSAIMWHHHAGLESTGTADYTVTSEVATITETDHGLEVGDPVFFDSSSGENIDGANTVVSVPTSSTYTCDVPGVSNEAGAATVNYIAGYTYANAAWVGLQATSDPGSSTWKFKRLSGVDSTNLVDLTSAEEAIALGKNCNVYTLLGATGTGFTHEGVLASGRFMDVQRSIDWLTARTGENLASRLLQVPKIPYTDEGMAIIEAEIAAVMEQAAGIGILGPILDSTSGELYRIVIPKVADQSSADRADRLVLSITVAGQLAGAVHALAITINLQT